MKKNKKDNLMLLNADSEKKRLWWQNKYFWISAGFSFFWIIFMIHYLSVSGWWQNRFNMTPAELSGGLGGLALPMVVFWLVCAYFDRTEQLESEARLLKNYLNELVYPTEEGAIYTRTLTDALRLQIKEFRSVFQEVNNETQEVREDLKRWVRDLSAIIKHANTKTIASIREIGRHIQSIAQATELATQQASKASGVFSEQATILERIVGGTVQATTELSQSLGSNAADIRALVQEVNNINMQTTQSVAKSEQVMLGLSQNSAKIEETINLYENSARQQNARLFGNLEKVLSVFRAHGDLLEQEVAKTASRLEAVEKALKNQASDMLKTADSAIQKTDEANVIFNATKEELKDALVSFQSEAATIVGQIEKAGKKMNAVPVVQTIRTGDMLKEANGILNRLQEFSVDMAHLFSPKAEEELWERYYNGDKTVFMRHIKSEISSGKFKKMKELYENNIGFRDSVDKYMAAFENITQIADKGDESKLMMSIVIGSDAGRLYMVLADVLKGKN